MNWLRKLLKRNNGWVSGGSYTITVPKGEWVIGQKITLKNSKLKAEPPTLKKKGQS